MAKDPREEEKTLVDSRRLAVDAAPVEFGRFVDPVVVARGGMGTILRAIDPDLDRPVAIKVLAAAGAPDPLVAARFLREARITGQLQHPGIPPVYELSRAADGRDYFALKLIEGRTLAEALDDLRATRREDPEARLRLLSAFVKVCDAIAYAHSRGVVHRDLKPANVMLGEFGEVLVLDWGIAKIRDASEDEIASAPPASATPALTIDGSVLGTPAYMAPEQAAGLPVDERSDVYALGAILYEILSLEPPRRGASAVEVLARIHEEEIVPPSVRSPWARIPADLDAAVARAMALRPAERYPGATALRSDVEAYLQGRTLSAARYRPWERLAKWIRRNRAVSLVAAVGAVSLLALAAWSFVSIDRERRQALETADLERLARERAERLEAEASDRAEREGDFVRLESLRSAAESLWPATVADLRAWLERAREVVARIDRHREELRRLRDLEPSALARWTLASQERLVAGLEALRDRAIPAIEDRLEAAAALERALEADRARWSEAIAAVAADPAFEGFRLRQLLGLTPLGPDPASGLREFAHLETGPAPRRGADGRLQLDGDSGVVFVLVPGGLLERPGAPPIRIAPFLVSKYELTRGQWLRATGQAAPASRALLAPASDLTWTRARQALRRLGLALPSESQWEHAARAGTHTRWWTGDDETSLEGAANFAGPRDGHDRAAPVGSFRPNPFGLHDVAGNVFEWCEDTFQDDPSGAPADGGPWIGEDTSLRVVKGGAYNLDPTWGRTAFRMGAAAGHSSPHTGVRPVRPLP